MLIAGISTAANVGMSIWGGNQQAAAAQEQAIAQNKATMARYQYDLDMWDMKKSQLQADRMEAVDQLLLQARNEGKVKAYQDAANLRQYEQDLKIRNLEQEGNEAAFKRSEEIYVDTTNLNAQSAKAAMESNIVKLEESYDEQAFDRNTAYLEMLQAERKLRAYGASGRSAAKGVQSTLADYGRQMEMVTASLDSNNRNTRQVLDEIIRDKTSADLTAYAQKMLDPGVLPEVIKPQPVPVPEFQLPRALQEFDFGPQPVKGAMASPGAAAQKVWGSTLTNIAGHVTAGASGAINSWIAKQ